MARLCFRSTSCHSTPSAKLVWLKADVPMAYWTSANCRGGLRSKYYPTILHCEQMNVACLSKYLPFSNGGRKHKFIALFFKALRQYIFKRVCNILFLRISSSFDAIYSLQERRMVKAHLVMKNSGKASLPGSCWEADLEPCSFCSLKFRLFSIDSHQWQRFGAWSTLRSRCALPSISHAVSYAR